MFPCGHCITHTVNRTECDHFPTLFEHIWNWKKRKRITLSTQNYRLILNSTPAAHCQCLNFFSNIDMYLIKINLMFVLIFCVNTSHSKYKPKWIHNLKACQDHFGDDNPHKKKTGRLIKFLPLYIYLCHFHVSSVAGSQWETHHS